RSVLKQARQSRPRIETLGQMLAAYDVTSDLHYDRNAFAIQPHLLGILCAGLSVRRWQAFKAFAEGYIWLDRQEEMLQSCVELLSHQRTGGWVEKFFGQDASLGWIKGVAVAAPE